MEISKSPIIVCWEEKTERTNKWKDWKHGTSVAFRVCPDFWSLLLQTMACLTWEAGPPPQPGSVSVLQAALHTIFPVMFPVMCSLILDRRPLDSRMMGSQIKKFSLFYYLLLYSASALEVGTIPRACQKFQLLSSIFQCISVSLPHPLLSFCTQPLS